MVLLTRNIGTLLKTHFPKIFITLFFFLSLINIQNYKSNLIIIGSLKCVLNVLNLISLNSGKDLAISVGNKIEKKTKHLW